MPKDKKYRLKVLLIISLSFNILGTMIACYVVIKRGGIPYLAEWYRGESKNTIDDDMTTNKFKKYHQQKETIFLAMPKDSNEIIFLGNSLIDHCEWHELFNNPNIKNRGVGGDLIVDVINRLDDVLHSNPDKIFIMIGINDVGKGRPVEDIIEDYTELISLLKEGSPNTKVFVHSVLPTSQPETYSSEHIIQLNTELKSLAENKQVHYINLYDQFKTENNLLNPSYTIDGLHINGSGYLIWKKNIDQLVSD